MGEEGSVGFRNLKLTQVRGVAKEPVDVCRGLGGMAHGGLKRELIVDWLEGNDIAHEQIVEAGAAGCELECGCDCAEFGGCERIRQAEPTEHGENEVIGQVEQRDVGAGSRTANILTAGGLALRFLPHL